MFIVAPHCQIMTQLGLKDSSRYLHVNCVIDFFPYLILHACVQTFDMMGEVFVLVTKQPLYLYVQPYTTIYC